MQAKLQQLREKRANGDHGFTLIELLVVVVIIGVLVAIAIPLYLNYRKGAENKAAQSDVRNAVGAIEACISDNAGKAPGAASTPYATDYTKAPAIAVINLTCVAAGTGSATPAATADTAAQQTINSSNGVTLTYTPDATNSAYTVKGTYAGSGHKTYTYTSSTGQTVAS